MKLEKKRGIDRIRIQHNKKLFWVIIVLIIILICLILYIKSQNENLGEGKQCLKNEDCIPATCCHPESCVPAEEASICRGVICSMVCSGPLDCGAGECGCVDGGCEVVPKE